MIKFLKEIKITPGSGKIDMQLSRIFNREVFYYESKEIDRVGFIKQNNTYTCAESPLVISQLENEFRAKGVPTKIIKPTTTAPILQNKKIIVVSASYINVLPEEIFEIKINPTQDYLELTQNGKDNFEYYLSNEEEPLRFFGEDGDTFVSVALTSQIARLKPILDKKHIPYETQAPRYDFNRPGLKEVIMIDKKYIRVIGNSFNEIKISPTGDYLELTNSGNTLMYKFVDKPWALAFQKAGNHYYCRDNIQLIEMFVETILTPNQIEYSITADGKLSIPSKYIKIK